MKAYLKLATALVAIDGLSTVAFAQGQPAADRPAAAEDGSGLSDIIVTARRREEALQSVPVAITVLDGAALAARQITNVSALQTVAPSLTLSGAAGRRQTPAIGIRGQLTSDTLISADPAVAVYVDEVIMTPNQGINMGLYDLGNVQVLKGPQGTLFGRNTTGGAVLFSPNQPKDVLEGEVKAHIGNYDERGGTAMVNLPITDTLAVRIAGNYLRHDGYARIVAGPQTGRQLESENNHAIRFIAKWSPADNFTNSFTFDYAKGRSGGTAAVLTALNPASSIRFYNGGAPFNLGNISAALARQQARSVREVEADAPIFERTKSQLVINKSTLNIGELQLKNIFGYRKVDYALGYDGDDSTISIFAVNNPARVKQYSDELQLSGSALDGRTSWITGLYYFRQTGRDLSFSTSYIGLNANSPNFSGGDVKNTSYSVYAQQTTEIVPSLSLTTGVRYSRDKRNATVIAFTSPQAPQPNLCSNVNSAGVRLPITDCFVNLKKTFSKPTWTVSLDYKPAPGTLLYIASRRGYRTGGFNLRANNPVAQLPFKPETVTDFEGGAKLNNRWLGFPMRINAATYLQKYKQIQRVITFINPQSGGATSSIVNAASATIWGFELETTLVPTKGVEFNFGYSYVDPKYDRFQAAAGDFSDRKFSRIPKSQFNASVDLTMIDDDDTGKVVLTGAYNYRSGYHLSDLFQNGQQVRTQAGLSGPLVASIPNTLPGEYIKGVGLFDARLSWSDIGGSKVSVAGYVKNLTNKTYANSGLSLYESLGLIYNTYGDPRTYGLEVSIRY